MNGDPKLTTSEGKVCWIEVISVDFTLILASVRIEKGKVFLSTSTNPPHWFAIVSKFPKFHESIGRPLIAIQPLNLEILESITLTSLWNLLRERL